MLKNAILMATKRKVDGVIAQPLQRRPLRTPITQDEQKEFLQLQNEYAEMKAQFEAAKEKFKKKEQQIARSRSPIKPGLYKTQRKKWEQRHPRYRKDGIEALAEIIGHEAALEVFNRVRDQTKAVTHYYAWVE
jgi:predicted nuclease with TOPRIM domain